MGVPRKLISCLILRSQAGADLRVGGLRSSRTGLGCQARATGGGVRQVPFRKVIRPSLDFPGSILGRRCGVLKIIIRN